MPKKKTHTVKKRSTKKPAKEQLKKLRVVNPAGDDVAELEKTRSIFEYTVKSVASFYVVYQGSKKGHPGSTTHEDQDQLRAMLVFACSGLDAVVKQLIKDTLPRVIDKDTGGTGAQEQFRKFVARTLKKPGLGGTEERLGVDTDFIARILTSSRPRTELVNALQEMLLDGSLQSTGELLKAASHFAITQSEVLKEQTTTDQAFRVRNDIIHEMDVKLSSSSPGQKKRRVRGSTEMTKYTENILAIASCFISVVASRLTN